MKRVTIWLSKLANRDWEHNHIEDGWSTRDVPHGNENQAKAWRSYEWKRIYGWMTDDNKVKPNDSPYDTEISSW